MNTPTNEMTLTLTMPIHGAYVTIDARDCDLMQHRWYTTQSGQVFRTAPRNPDGTRAGIYLIREIAARIYGPLGTQRVRSAGGKLDLQRGSIELIVPTKPGRRKSKKGGDPAKENRI